MTAPLSVVKASYLPNRFPLRLMIENLEEQARACREVIAAVLTRGVLDALQPAGMVTKEHKRTARRWIGLDSWQPNLSRHRRLARSGWTFAECCEVLNLCPKTVWGNLKKLEREHGAAPPKCGKQHSEFFKRVADEANYTPALAWQRRSKYSIKD